METDPISSLMQRGTYHHLIINILIHLDEASLANTAAVCRVWHDFMVTNIKQKKQFLSRRLQLHWREKTPEVDSSGEIVDDVSPPVCR